MRFHCWALLEAFPCYDWRTTFLRREDEPAKYRMRITEHFGGGVRALVYAYSVYWQFVAHLTNPPAYHKSKKWKHPIWHWCSAYFKSISGKRIIYTSNVNNNMITGSYSQMLYVLRYSDDLGRQVRQPAILRWCLSTCMSSYVCMLVLYRFQCNFWCKYHISRDIS